MSNTPRTLTALMGATLLAAGCATAPGGADMSVKGATPATVSANQAMNQTVATFNPRDFEDATRGKLAELSDPIVKALGWTFYTFIGGGARFMCSWATTEEAVDHLAHDLETVLAG